ncbi:unnamed protein product [Oppiella nova]|uniref:Resistance to inhibitors of cholinesterase protein 3 N-terminal domain-containing protein n=1 Tax=Oppiella nova TaxID=334625 RepID=A0A7R9MJN1_9ACAR|nr:unnamed protein product [Oppiella nova]CAG2178357.1 unnamed protein product [Oppiella nova]
MFQSAISMTSDHTESTRDDVSLLPPKVREAMKLSRPQEFQRLAGRPFQRESKININDTPNKTTTGGVMGLLMPLYTIGIIVFFMYTILRTIKCHMLYHIVSKALHVLIRDMEEFKTKLNEVEIYKNQTKQMDSTAEDAKLIINEEV